MKSYLSLIPISAKVRKRQNRMTILCIIFAVFLVTAIFSMADMVIRTQSGFMLQKHGNWHIRLENISTDTADEIRRRPDVAAAGLSSVFNLDGEQPCSVNEKKAVLYGSEETYMTQIMNGITEGSFPRQDDEVMLSPNAADALQVQPGDPVTLHTPAGDAVFTVSGFGCDDKAYYQDQTFLVGVYMTQTAFASLMAQNKITGQVPSCYVQFQNAKKAANAIARLASQYKLPEGNISENTAVMGMAGQSDSESLKNIYGLAAILFLLVLLAGVLMISGSMNSNVLQRTKFFGMLRCIGASRQQIVQFVRLEALNWCKTAVPAGIILGTLINWGLCAALHYGIGGEFATMPVFLISPVGIISGAVVGMVTVLLAAQSPAKRASRVSPVSAVSGNTEVVSPARHAAKPAFLKIDLSLGMHHAVAAKKSWCFITASFSLSIILFFSFSSVMDFMRLLLPAMNVTSADVVLNGYGNEMVFERHLIDEIKAMDGVANAYGCTYLDHIPAASSRAGTDHINMVSYDDSLLDYAKESVAQGNLDEIYGDSNRVATVFNRNNPLKVGDTIQIAGASVEVSCALSQGLFGDDLIVICSQETFDRLMGVQRYGLIGVQLTKDVPDETIAQLKALENDTVVVTDQRQEKQQTAATYWASRIIGYGFLSIIAMITFFNMMNNISMSVSARTKQYGAMRAVGMDNRQLIRMICAETATYAVSGLVVGCGLGIPLSRLLYTRLITHYFGIAWQPPAASLGIVTVFVFVSSIAAVYAPSRRICRMAVTETLNEL